MLLKWFLCAAVLSFSPVTVHSKDASRGKRSDDFIPCDKGWFSFREKCFKIGGKKRSDRLSWEKAASRCSTAGGHLVTIQSEEELDFLVSFLLLDIRTNVWIGLHDRGNESEYSWNDGSTVNYTNWKELEPTGLKDDNEDCVEMLFEPERDIIGKWNDIACNHEFAYICQTKINKRKKSPNPQYCSSDAGGGWKFQSSCYHVVTEMKKWQDAEQHCKDNFSGHLVTVLDTTVDFFLDHILSNIKKELWIGIKIKDELQQKWTSGWHVSYNGMNKDHGDFIDGTCVLRIKRKLWTMVPCSKRYSFICEISKASPPVLKPPMRGSYCPEIPDCWRDLDGEFCYFIQTEESINWYEANFECKRRGGNLLSLHSVEESAVLHQFIRFTQQRIYIGLLRVLMHEDVFAWSDDSSMDFINWSYDEPNNEDEKCGEVWSHDMKWNDANCEEKKGYICSVKKISPNSSRIIETTECTGLVSYKALIGVAFCILLVIFLLGVIVYYFRSWDMERRKTSTAVTIPQRSPSNDRPRYRSQTELTIKDEDPKYESVY